MKYCLQLFCTVLLLLAPKTPTWASLPNQSASHPSTEMGMRVFDRPINLKKPGLLQQFQLLKAAKQQFRESGIYPEKASKMSRTALILLIGSYIVGFLGASIGLTSIVFAALYLAAFVASIVLSIIVLLKEDNPKSRKIARIVLLISGIMIVAAALLTVVLLHFFPNN